MTAENYHLKWDSHSTYLNSSVATLYKNEKYADVVLYSSNTTASSNSSMPTVGISAHKFILSSCSQFFSSIFETSPIANNGLFHIVLPPDLSHRAIQILVQYMYVGEATVSNDILNEVLKGGEILKIRGLCRTSPPVTNIHQNRTDAPTTSNATYNLIRMPPLNTSGPTSVRYLVEQQSVSRALGASAITKNSPVIIKSTKPLSTLTVPSSVNIGKLTSTSAITVNKHVAIDPGDKCCYTQETSTTVLRNESTSICNEMGCNGCTAMTENPPQIMLQRDGQSQSNDGPMMCTKNCPDQCSDRGGSGGDYMQPTTTSECVEEESTHLYEQEMQLTNLATEQHVESMHDYEVSDSFSYTNHLAPQQQRPKQTTTIMGEGEMQQHLQVSSPPTLPPSAHTQVHETPYVSIKEEPSDWLATSNPQHQVTSLEPLKKNGTGNSTDFKVQKIKTEPSPSTSTLNMDAEACQLLSTTHAHATSLSTDFESYFSCDICKKTCDDKTSLLRHLETHTATPCSSGFNASAAGETTVPPKSYVPKKRRRISQQENNADHVCLQCDLCTTRFETPAEWVRHMSSQHTEVELAMFNNKKDAEKNQPSSNANHHKKLSCNLQQQHSQRVQALSGSTNSNLPNSTSVLGTTPNVSINETNATGYLRSTLSPA